MPESSAFLHAIKQCLKAKGMSYGELAARLELSESSVKRLFSREALTLKRLEDILAVLELTMLDVAKLAATEAAAEPGLLTLEQETTLAADRRLFSFFHLLLFGGTVAKIVASYAVSMQEAERWLRELDELRLLDRLPGGKIRMLVSRSIAWRPRGPLRAEYEDEIRRRFLAGKFDGELDLAKFATRRLGVASQAALNKKLLKVFTEMDALSALDTGDATQRAEVSCLYVAFRPYEFDGLMAFERRRRKNERPASGK